MLKKKLLQSLYLYQTPPRLPFKKVSSEDLDYFRTILPPFNILTDPEEIKPFNTSWIKKEKGSSPLVVTPQSQNEVSMILKYCNENKIAVVPQGGNTGLVGGSVPVYDEVIISLKKMNKIAKFDPLSAVLSVEAGVILEKVNEYLGDYQF